MDKLSINKIKKLNMSFYNCSLDKIINHIFSRMDFVKSIIVYGNINHPGISDLDLILVLNEGTYFKDFQLIKLYRYLRKNFSEIIFHYPLFIHEKFVSELNYLFPIFSYSIIERDGTKRKINLTTTSTQKKFHLLQVFLTKFPKNFKLYNEIDNSNFREFLLEINSLKHTFRIFQELNPKELFNEINFFNNKIDTIRQDQVNGILHEKSDIIKFFEETKSLFFEMVKKLNGGAIDQYSSKEDNMYKTSAWVSDQLKLISANNSYLSKKIIKEYLNTISIDPKPNSYKYTLELLDEYIQKTSKVSFFFGSSKFITLGIETNPIKKFIKNVIQFI